MRRFISLFLAALILFASVVMISAAEMRLLGDVNANGIIDAGDYAMAKRAVLGTFDLSDEQKLVADANKNRKVDAGDYAMIKRTVLGTYDLNDSVETEEHKTAHIKVGLICLHDEHSEYDSVFIEGAKKACSKRYL